METELEHVAYLAHRARQATPELHEAIRQARADGHTLRAIGQAAGVSFQAVAQICKLKGPVSRSEGPRWVRCPDGAHPMLEGSQGCVECEREVVEARVELEAISSSAVIEAEPEPEGCAHLGLVRYRDGSTWCPSCGMSALA